MQVARLLGASNLGRLDYVFKPWLRKSWGGPFNGQRFRQRIFLSLIGKAGCEAVVETGTFMGTTTLFVACAGLPVYSVESDPRCHAYSALRLSRHKDRIHLYEGDSCVFLRSLSRDVAFPKGRVFFYLDAHSYGNLPLREELEIIFGAWSEPVVMIDDFQVPGTDYGYDDYGPGQVLNLAYLDPLRHLQLAPFFPAVGPEGETGSRRGCVVLGKGSEMERLLSGIDSLRPVVES